MEMIWRLVLSKKLIHCSTLSSWEIICLWRRIEEERRSDAEKSAKVWLSLETVSKERIQFLPSENESFTTISPNIKYLPAPEKV